MALVDQYDGLSMTDQLPILELPNLHQPSDGPHLTVSDKVEDDWPPPGDAWPASSQTKVTIKELDIALKDPETDPEHVHMLYKNLPAPRVPYLESKTRHLLLRHLAIVERKDEQSMLRYFSIIDDMKSTAIPLTVREWTSAMSFAARYVTRSTPTEVEAALYIWREMEHVAGVKANHATFNVLFDVACKAGKLNLAEMIYKEMATRGLEYNRYHHVSLITFYGLKGDGLGLREAYKNLVEANEIVDTTVINSLIAGLLRCDEDQAATAVYERMKSMHIARGGAPSPPPSFKSKRKITSTLLNMGEMVKKNPALREQVEKGVRIAPDVQTYRILVNHFSVKMGDLHRTTQFLDEMRWFDLPLHGAMFLALLKGFATHGGVRYSHWTERRLESVWAAFLHATEHGGEEQNDGLYISRWMAIWAVRAFAKCSGKSKMIEVWEELRVRWNPEQADLDFVLSLMRPLLEGEDMALKQNDWLEGFR
ncbi:hypothetical protein BP6252_12182 [Coleophoma cylindrospora]|uniref:Pentatricopeptide repeat protein n=1 Tax=Coleophoma cylindrospora TaxID=1849047 RepID=A0A3D8QG91_9HELO|nr:hypothetical protein BP6252_12182 [Coleophoma cylindrospora]